VSVSEGIAEKSVVDFVAEKSFDFLKFLALPKIALFSIFIRRDPYRIWEST